MLNALSADELAVTMTPTFTKAQAEERRRMTDWLEARIVASKKKPSAEVVTLTPMLAQLLLEEGRNPVNRPLSQRNSADIGADIANGRFEFNGESIVISNTGILIDGQHRCAQVAATKHSIETVIVFGPNEAARFTIDIGKSKTVSNFLAMKGRHYTGVLGAAVGYHLQWRKIGALLYGGGKHYPTKPEILAAADETRGMETSVEFTVPAMKSPVRSHAVLAFCHFVFWKKTNRESADQFILRLIEGDGLRRNDPILYCRNRLIKSGRSVPAGERAELIFKCWNAHRLGNTIDHLKISGGALPKVER